MSQAYIQVNRYKRPMASGFGPSSRRTVTTFPLQLAYGRRAVRWLERKEARNG